jgi:hypothetical protein
MVTARRCWRVKYTHLGRGIGCEHTAARTETTEARDCCRAAET